MQLKKITLACAAALAVSPAFAAFDPADVGAATKLYLSGATAPDNFLKDATVEMLDAGYKTYRNNDLTAAFQYRAFFGSAKAGIPNVTAGTPMLVIKRSKGGSVWGVDPIARGSRIESLDFTACVNDNNTTSVTKDGGATYNYLCGVKGKDPESLDFTNPAVNDGDVPDVGVSDVSPALFQGPYNVEFGQSQLATVTNPLVNGGGGLDALDIKPVNTVMMAIVATSSVPATTRIGRADYANMLGGNIQDWTQIDPSATGNTQVVVCRRVNGSGTQASYNWFFNNFPCQSAFAGAMEPTSMLTHSASGIVSGSGIETDPKVIDPTQGYTVVNNSTSGDVRNCLNAANTHVNHKFLGDDGIWYQINFGNDGNPFKAIGVLSLDSYNSSGTGSNGEGTNWTYRMMDGAGTYAPGTNVSSVGATGTAPSKANLLSGAYDFAVELTMQYRKLAVKNPQGDSIGVLAVSTKKSFADELIKRAGDPAKIALNSKKNAYAALPDFYNPATNATNLAHVALGSHKSNMCQPLIRKY